MKLLEKEKEFSKKPAYKKAGGFWRKARAFCKTPYFKTTAKIVLIIVIASSLLVNLFTYVTPIVRYYGSGMQPNLTDKQILVLAKTKNVSSGDIIAFYYNNKVLVRRVVCTGGKQVSMDIFGSVSVNGEELSEPYIAEKSLGQCNVEFPYNVPPKSVFVLGDNRITAMDSRLKEIGAISEDRIIGKVLFSIYPPKPVK